MINSLLKNLKIEEHNIPCDVLFVLNRIKDSGFLSFLVGGCVRDLLLGREVKDWDILTNANPKQIKSIFKHHKTFMIGKSWQTVTLIYNQKSYQISSCHNYEVNNQTQLIKNNLICRDFTINSIAWNQKEGFFDPANGLRDLSRKILQSNHPEYRFKEDPLRMLRAVRMLSELDFRLNSRTRDSIKKNAYLICNISAERIRKEIEHIFDSSNSKRAVVLLQQFRLDKYIFCFDRKKKIIIFCKEGKIPALFGFDKLRGNLAAQLALWGRIYFTSSQNTHKFFLPLLKCLKFNNKILKIAKILLSNEWQDIDFSSRLKIRFLLSRVGRDNVKTMMLLKKIWLSKTDRLQHGLLEKEEKLFYEEIKRNNPVKLADLAINGNDLKRLGILDGNRIGFILKRMLNKVIIHPNRNNKRYLIDYVKEYFM